MEDDLIRARRSKLQAIKDAGLIPFPNGFTPSTPIGEFIQSFEKSTKEDDGRPAGFGVW